MQSKDNDTASEISDERTVPFNGENVPLAPVMGLLRENTAQRNYAESKLVHANSKIKELNALHIATLARLMKYEGGAILLEVYKFAVENDMFINCASSLFNVKFRVGEYKAKNSGHISQAHYTYYGHYFELTKYMVWNQSSTMVISLLKNFKKNFVRYIYRCTNLCIQRCNIPKSRIILISAVFQMLKYLTKYCISLFFQLFSQR
jgi:hypothetical protein